MRVAQITVLIAFALSLPACGGGGGGGAPTDDLLFLEVFHTEEFAQWGTSLGGVVPGLVTFKLEFLNGDHHVASIAAGGVFAPTVPDPDTFVMELGDGDGDDPVSLTTRYYDLQAVGIRHVVTDADLQDVARIPLDPPLGPGERFILSGFAFHTAGSNHHVRVLRVEPFPDLGYVEVEYRDDSPADDRYTATVAYLIVPATHGPGAALRPSFDGPYTETFSFSGRTTTAPRMPGITLLRGFSLAFRGGDRHLEAAEVDLGWSDAIYASLRDGDVDIQADLVDARVSYHIMQP